MPLGLIDGTIRPVCLRSDRFPAGGVQSNTGGFMEEKDARTTINRRRLLRRVGTVAAGVGAAGVAGAVVASPASAAQNDPVLAGDPVNAGSATTSITNNSPANPTLSLVNTGSPTVGGQLQLAPTLNDLMSSAGTVAAPVGTINALNVGTAAAPDVDFEMVPAPNRVALMYSSWNSTVTWPVSIFRAMDTRGLGGMNGDGSTGTGRENILNPGVLRSDGKLPAGQTLLLNLTPFVQFGYAALANVTVQTPESNGFITIWPAQLPRPTGSNINYLLGWPVSNGVVAALGDNDPTNANDFSQTDVVQIFTAQTTHIIFDVLGFIAPSIGNINPIFSAVSPAGKHPATANGSAVSRFEKARAAKVKW
jgi:hypothetical protein